MFKYRQHEIQRCHFYVLIQQGPKVTMLFLCSSTAEYNNNNVFSCSGTANPDSDDTKRTRRRLELSRRLSFSGLIIGLITIMAVVVVHVLYYWVEDQEKKV